MSGLRDWTAVIASNLSFYRRMHRPVCYVGVAALVLTVILALFWGQPWIKEKIQAGRSAAPGASRTVSSSPPSLLDDARLKPRSSLQRAASVFLLDLSQERKVSKEDLVKYLDHFGWDADRVAACYYIVADELFMNRLIELVDSSVTAALVVALEAPPDGQHRLKAAQSLQNLDPHNALGYLLEAYVLLGGGGNETSIASLIESALEKNEFRFYVAEREGPIYEFYRSLSLPPESVLAHSSIYSAPIAHRPGAAVWTLGQQFSQMTSADALMNATTQIHLSQMLRDTLDAEFADAKCNSYWFELTLNNAEHKGLRDLPPDTYYGNEDVTIADRLDEIKTATKDLVATHSAALEALAHGSDLILEEFFTVWEESGYRAAIRFMSSKSDGND